MGLVVSYFRAAGRDRCFAVLLRRASRGVDRSGAVARLHLELDEVHAPEVRRRSGRRDIRGVHVGYQALAPTLRRPLERDRAHLADRPVRRHRDADISV